jgi:hypothetical protein
MITRVRTTQHFCWASLKYHHHHARTTLARPLTQMQEQRGCHHHVPLHKQKHEPNAARALSLGAEPGAEAGGVPGERVHREVYCGRVVFLSNAGGERLQ